MKKQEAQFRFVDFRVVKSIYQMDVNKFQEGGKLDVNNIDVSNMKPADAGANGTKIGNRIIE